MQLLAGRNINTIWPMALTLLAHGVPRDSRNGPVVKARTPVTTHYTHPHERVLFDARRDCNPFFHLAEALWILGGREDVAFLSQFVKRMAEFSDNGETFHAPYGYRLRHHWDHDQLQGVVRLLRKDPHSRRAYLSIWCPADDLFTNYVSKDLPCNVGAKVWLDEGRLHLTVFNRSNDVVWGAYGANVVQFSMLQEYLAMQLGARMGELWQVSTDWHGYTQVLTDRNLWTTPKHDLEERYERRAVLWYPMAQRGIMAIPGEYDTFLREWDDDLRVFLDSNAGRQETPRYITPYFKYLVAPMFAAYWGRTTAPLATALDWHVAGAEWLLRRGVMDERRFTEQEDDGN